MLWEKSCGAVIFRKGQETEYLILKYEAGHWDFAKGNIEADESEKDTVIREIKEETGIGNIEFVADFREEIKYFYRRDDNLVSKRVVFFLVEAKESEVKLSFEHVDYEWLTHKKALQRLTFKTAKRILEKASRMIKNSDEESEDT